MLKKAQKIKTVAVAFNSEAMPCFNRNPLNCLPKKHQKKSTKPLIWPRRGGLERSTPTGDHCHHNCLDVELSCIMHVRRWRSAWTPHAESRSTSSAAAANIAACLLDQHDC
mmetsp:Transcript_164545/g.523221  ORF Transcript_164545/g.523221 Transcript_164545/m.523221 type:complete len:111 (-) Transcript_164545:251-583(-)